jgi:hypothetical protein
MKIFLTIFLVLSLIFAISCYNTPEKKIIHAIEKQDYMQIKILGVNIVDTIYEAQVVDTLISDLAKIDSLNKWMKSETNVKKYRNYDRLREFTDNRIRRLYEINYNVNDSAISGYYVLLRTDRDTLEVAIKRDFSMLAPRFMLEYHDRPRREFRPEFRQPPRPRNPKN